MQALGRVLYRRAPGPAHRVARSPSGPEPAHRVARSHMPADLAAGVRPRRQSASAELSNVSGARFPACMLLLHLTPPSMLTKTAGHADKSSNFHEQARSSVSVLGFSCRHWFSVSVLGLGSRYLVIGARRCILVRSYRFTSFSSLCFPATDSHS